MPDNSQKYKAKQLKQCQCRYRAAESAARYKAPETPAIKSKAKFSGKKIPKKHFVFENEEVPV